MCRMMGSKDVYVFLLIYIIHMRYAILYLNGTLTFVVLVLVLGCRWAKPVFDAKGI